jgi:hypothetical protein
MFLKKAHWENLEGHERIDKANGIRVCKIIAKRS